MDRTASRLLLTAVAIGGVVLAAAYAVARRTPTIPSIATPVRAASDAATIERGRYLATAGDCIACHTGPAGRAFAGGLALATPIGRIYSTNITPDKATGIGAYTLDDFDRALRHGIARGNVPIYPAMPYPSYARMTPDDIAAMYAYFMHGVEAVDAPNQPVAIAWPLSIRWPLALWRDAFAPNPSAIAFDAARYPTAEIARGAYLVQGPGHCGACHTPRAPTLQEKSLDERSPSYLAGGPSIDGWLAVNLRGGVAEGLGGWSRDDIVATLRTGRNPTRAVVGAPMNDVVEHSLQHLKDADLRAIAAYLKTLGASPEASSYAAGEDYTSTALRAGVELSRGAEIYVDSCAACHGTGGRGQPHGFPAIAGNSSVLSADPTSLIKLVLEGSMLPATVAAPSPLGMPGFAWRLSDEELAQLLTFVRTGWGNRAPLVSAAAVAAVRARAESEHVRSERPASPSSQKGASR